MSQEINQRREAITISLGAEKSTLTKSWDKILDSGQTKLER